jgi:hypothetical protein
MTVPRAGDDRGIIEMVLRIDAQAEASRAEAAKGGRGGEGA